LTSILSILLLLAVVCVPFLAVVMLIVIVSKLRKRNRRRPFTQNFLREAGHSLRIEIESIDERFYGFIALIMATPLYVYASHLSQSYLAAREETTFRIAFSLLLTIVVISYATMKILQLAKERKNKRLGLEGEIAVGQMLDPLLREGGWIFHDFQAGAFNIDHILVNQAGVFAIETKTRSKSTVIDKSRAMKVVFDGKRLQFPEHSETAPIDQAKRQAKWLTDWLEGAVGASIAVQPVVAIPGWYVELKGRYDVIVTNPRKPEFLAQPMQGKPILNRKLIDQIVFQLDRHCRDFVPGEERAS